MKTEQEIKDIREKLVEKKIHHLGLYKQISPFDPNWMNASMIIYGIEIIDYILDVKAKTAHS